MIVVADAVLAPDLTACDQEPIHIPGHIQPHGVMVATYPNSLRISHVSANIERSMGIPASHVLNAMLDEIFGSELVAALASPLQRSSHLAFETLKLNLPIPKQSLRSISMHRHLGRVIIEFLIPEPHEEQERSLSFAQKIIVSLRNAETVDDLCSTVTREIRALIGCDRAMIYRFDADGNGTVIAEDKADALESFLDLHYPASDIPQQARRLYKMERVRGIPDMLYLPESLLAAPGMEEDTQLDMTHCALRGVSPLHREYMANMNVSGTVTVSLMHDTELWGMIVCHHGSTLPHTFEIRAFCDLIGQLVSVLLRKVSEADELNDKLGRLRLVTALGDSLEGVDDVAGALSRQSNVLLALMKARGALIRIGGATIIVGEAPSHDVAVKVVNHLSQETAEEIVALSAAGLPGAVAEFCPGTASGILLMPILNTPGDAIAWFRPEMPRTVLWAGEPGKTVMQDATGVRISPRKSFAAWTEQVSGRSDPWTAVDMQTAGEVRRAVTSALLRSAEAKLAQLSAYDPLTNLANRRTLKTRMEESRLQRRHDVASMLFFDLDRFKMINDSLGHAAGDQVLIEVAVRITEMVPEGATAARMGGDEFVVFLPGKEKMQAVTLADTIVNCLSRPLKILERDHHITVSVGIACTPMSDVGQLLREADEAMYAAKRQGGGQSILFQPSIHAGVLSASQLEQDLFAALNKDELEVHYQPIVTVPDRSVKGFEALVRWPHVMRGWIPPSEFIPRAEETGLIKRIGPKVFTRAVEQLALWHAIDSELTMSINVSARQLTEGSFSAFAEGVLNQAHVKPTTIRVEVTESALMHESAVRELHQLRKLGIKVAVDDFGTGYSSLAYLQSLPVDIVKLDRSFISRLGTSAKADAFFAAVLSLAHTLGIRTIAEGCETEEQWDIIARGGCHAVQGWLISRALDATSATALIERSRSSVVQERLTLLA